MQSLCLKENSINLDNFAFNKQNFSSSDNRPDINNNKQLDKYININIDNYFNANIIKPFNSLTKKTSQEVDNKLNDAIMNSDTNL
jgi:hypothetical protein